MQRGMNETLESVLKNLGYSYTTGRSGNFTINLSRGRVKMRCDWLGIGDCRYTMYLYDEVKNLIDRRMTHSSMEALNILEGWNNVQY